MLAHVVQPWSKRPADWPLQAGLLSHALEYQFRGLTQNGPPVMISQKRTVRPTRWPRGVLIAIAHEDANEVGADRHQPTLVELRLANRQDRLVEVDIGHRQR
jgi:hypothetical protein